MKTISLLLLSLMMALVHPALAWGGRLPGSGPAMSQDNVTSAKQKMTTQSEQTVDQNAQAQTKTDAAQDQTKTDSTTKQ